MNNFYAIDLGSKFYFFACACKLKVETEHFFTIVIYALNESIGDFDYWWWFLFLALYALI